MTSHTQCTFSRRIVQFVNFNSILVILKKIVFVEMLDKLVNVLSELVQDFVSDT